ncbi:MAG: zinc ribbon domain-containing protein [Prevotella sp.]|nr:zinc ribbon domain-containing protein [Prevotella sp.]
MTDEYNSDIERTARPQRTLRPELAAEEPEQPIDAQPQMQMQQLQAAGVECPYCGAMNEPEAMFCSSCGKPISMTTCPHCGSEMEPDADFCEVCHHYAKKDVCSFCGAHLEGNEAYCPECGSPRGGLVCPVCHTLNDFAFCKQCGTALTEEAKQLQRELQLNPDYIELLDAAQEFARLDNSLPYNSERDIIREQMNNKLRERVLTLLAKDQGIENPVISKVDSKRMTKQELAIKKSEKIKQLSEILDRLAVPQVESPVKARNYAMASKPVGVRLAWVCNFKHAMHSSPCGCAKPHLGGKWVILGKGNNTEIKDDK